MSVSVLNTDSSLSGKTVSAIENDETITGNKTFDRDPSAPFTVTSGSAKVTNLDADKVDGKEATDLMLLDGTQAMTAKLDLGTIGQVQFPATQNASTGANVLDDYEEGTFTPTITGSTSASGQAYTQQVGYYQKIGRWVQLDIKIVLSTLGTITGAVAIGGLPFPVDSGGISANTFVAPVFWSSLTNAKVALVAVPIDGTSIIDLFGSGAAATSLGSLVQADLSNTTTFIISVRYRTTA